MYPGSQTLARRLTPEASHQASDGVTGALYVNGVLQDSLSTKAVATREPGPDELSFELDFQRGVFTPYITLRNTGRVGAKLISRHWVITDADGDVEEVRGLGVVGRQPLIAPGERFEYTSGCALATSVGTMHGSYQMHAVDGTRFEAEIPPFTLSIPRILH